MSFSDYVDAEQPSFEVFNEANALVFDFETRIIDFDTITKEARKVMQLWRFDNEVSNGGFDQLFFNTLGNELKEIEALLNEFNADQALELLNQAKQWFPQGKPSPDRSKRWQQMEPFCETKSYADAISELNKAYYNGPSNQMIGLLDEYVINNPDAAIEADWDDGDEEE